MWMQPMNVRITLPPVEPSSSVTPRVHPLTAGGTPPASEGPMISDIFYGAPDPVRFRIWHPLCTVPLDLARPLLDKGKPAVRRGRKTTGQAESLTAELPKEGW